ncbi:unnamed protein product [Lactuca saligna]|uniref:HTH myb-type domain-containing protein n=1 Tax=Lactuca saligna TaxID=75948 RepID=A0AA36A0M6_LACSI|nr:unnamed protein product [Lactuca saligna]
MYAYLNNRQSGEDQEMNKSSMSVSSMENRDHAIHSSKTKKNKIIWTPDLHKKFLEAIEKIGVEEAVPKKILGLMKVDGLTRDHIASHLQKYRIYLKKIADANNHVQIASKPSLLESSMINEDSWRNSSLIPNQQKNFTPYSGMHEMMNPPLLDTSSFSFPILEASSSNPITSSQVAHSHALPNQGYSMQASTMLQQMTPKSLDDVVNLGIMSSGYVSSSSCMENLDGFMYDNGGSTTYVHPYTSSEMGSFGGLYTNNELQMSWINHEGSNGFENNYSSHGEVVETGLFYSSNSNMEMSNYPYNEMDMNIDSGNNVQNMIGEDDLILDASCIASLWETFFPEESYVDSYGEYGSTSNNLPVIYEPPYKDVYSQNLPNMVSFNSIHNKDHVNKKQHSNEHVNKQLMESVEDDVTLRTFLNTYVQD